jgi:hypothetical protein
MADKSESRRSSLAVGFVCPCREVGNDPSRAHQATSVYTEE